MPARLVTARPPTTPRARATSTEALSTWEAAGFSGSIAVTGAGAPECVAAFGVADPASGRANTPDTVFSLGSVSKAVTAAAVFRLVDAGALALDDRAGDLVPGLAGPATDATVEQLLVHTSGLAGRARDRPRTARPRRRGGRDRQPPDGGSTRERVPVLQRRLHAAGGDRRGGGRRAAIATPSCRAPSACPTAASPAASGTASPRRRAHGRSASSRTVPPASGATSPGRTGP